MASANRGAPGPPASLPLSVATGTHLLLLKHSGDSEESMGMIKPFLRLEDYLAPFPLAALLAILMVCGIKHLGARLIRRLQPAPPQPLQTAAGFILAAAMLGAAVHLLALAGVGLPLAIKDHGLVRGRRGHPGAVSDQPERLLRLYDQAAAGFREQSLWGQAACVLLGVTLAGLLLGALGLPPMPTPSTITWASPWTSSGITKPIPGRIGSLPGWRAWVNPSISWGWPVVPTSWEPPCNSPVWWLSGGREHLCPG